MPELQINVPAGSNLAGIARFYDSLVGAKVDVSEGAVQVTCGEMQKLAFVEQQPGVDVDHSDYHVSMYVDDFQNMFQRMAEHELIFVNPRFKRKASTLEEAVDRVVGGPRRKRSPAKNLGTAKRACLLERNDGQ